MEIYQQKALHGCIDSQAGRSNPVWTFLRHSQILVAGVELQWNQVIDSREHQLSQQGIIHSNQPSKQISFSGAGPSPLSPKNSIQRTKQQQPIPWDVFVHQTSANKT